MYHAVLQSSQVLGLVRRHFRARYDIRLTLEDYVQLLRVELVCGGDPKQLTHALSYIRTIKNVSYSACCPLHFETTRIGSVTRVLVVQIQWFSESLEEVVNYGL